jgi:hypothetical protein
LGENLIVPWTALAATSELFKSISNEILLPTRQLGLVVLITKLAARASNAPQKTQRKATVSNILKTWW